MKQSSNLIKTAILLAAILILGGQFLAAYKTNIRNQAIDGCASQSSYTASFEENGRQITVRETQKHLFDKCLLDKGIILNPAE